VRKANGTATIEHAQGDANTKGIDRHKTFSFMWRDHKIRGRRQTDNISESWEWNLKSIPNLACM
jgi:hypothetical protein